MKKVILLSAVMCILSGTTVQAYEFPHSFWAPNEAYVSAKNNGDAAGIIKYGNQVTDIIRSEPFNEQTADVMGSRLYDIGNAYEHLGEYDTAARCFDEYIKYGEYRGWDDGVKIAKAKTLQFTSALELYTPSSTAQKYYGAVNEPRTGTLVGQTSDSDTLDAESMILLYQEYGREIMPWVRVTLDRAEKSGRAVELALNFPGEGNQLAEILNDSSFLTELMNIISGYPTVPIYLRIGAEANIWSVKGDPELYKQVFRKIASAARSCSSNIATVWSMGHTASWYENTDDYYPGDEYVDWVGISAYCKKYFEGRVWNDEEKFNEVFFKSGDSADPVLMIKETVDKYGDRKPIMIAEGGAEHYTKSDTINEHHPEWALDYLKRIYNYVPMVYPQVKLIAYFNKYISSESSDYSLSSCTELNESYKELINLPHFINGSYSKSAENSYTHLNGEASASGSVTLFAYPHIFGSDGVKVDYYIDGVWVGGSQSIPYKRIIDLSGYSDGAHELKAVAESGGQYRAEKKITFNVSKIKIKINGEYAKTDVLPFIENDRTYVPVRLISENLGCEVEWEQDTQTAVVKRGGTQIRMRLGSRIVSVNGEEREINSAVQMRNDRTFLPIRAVSELLGCGVDWDGNDRCVIVSD